MVASPTRAFSAMGLPRRCRPSVRRPPSRTARLRAPRGTVHRVPIPVFTSAPPGAFVPDFACRRRVRWGHSIRPWANRPRQPASRAMPVDGADRLARRPAPPATRARGMGKRVRPRHRRASRARRGPATRRRARRLCRPARPARAAEWPSHRASQPVRPAPLAPSTTTRANRPSRLASRVPRGRLAS